MGILSLFFATHSIQFSQKYNRILYQRDGLMSIILCFPFLRTLIFIFAGVTSARGLHLCDSRREHPNPALKTGSSASVEFHIIQRLPTTPRIAFVWLFASEIIWLLCTLASSAPTPETSTDFHPRIHSLSSWAISHGECDRLRQPTKWREVAVAQRICPSCSSFQTCFWSL